jgi:hypothetical protein
VKFAGVIVLVAGAATALAGSGEARIQAAYEELALHPALTLRLEGTETIGSASVSVLTDLHFVRSEEGVGRFEMNQYRNGQLFNRVVGDGNTLWTYSPLRNEFAAMPYGSRQRPIQVMLEAAATAVQGSGAHVARLVKEVHGGEAPRYRSWMPGQAGTQTLSGVTYVRGNPATRRITFYLVTGEYGVERLAAVQYFDRVSVGQHERESSFMISVDAGENPPPQANFSFVPPTNARAIPPPRLHRW